MARPEGLELPTLCLEGVTDYLDDAWPALFFCNLRISCCTVFGTISVRSAPKLAPTIVGKNSWGLEMRGKSCSTLERGMEAVARWDDRLLAVLIVPI